MTYDLTTGRVFLGHSLMAYDAVESRFVRRFGITGSLVGDFLLVVDCGVPAWSVVEFA